MNSDVFLLGTDATADVSLTFRGDTNDGLLTWKEDEDYFEYSDSLWMVDDRKISLGIKQLSDNPWDKIESKYPIGSVHDGKVNNLTQFGAFIELEEGVDGLVHVSDMSWTQLVRHPKDILKKGSPLNFNEFEKNNCASTIFHGITYLVDFVDDNPDTFVLLCLRSFGQSFYHHITDAALEFGYVGV